jgi:hypothetical protein
VRGGLALVLEFRRRPRHRLDLEVAVDDEVDQAVNR